MRHMHECEEFRERITEHIIDREDLKDRVDFQRELLFCRACAEFYAESREMIEAFSSVELEVSEEHWEAMTADLKSRLLRQHFTEAAADPKTATSPGFSRRISSFLRPEILFHHLPGFAAIAAVLIVTVALYRQSGLVVEKP